MILEGKYLPGKKLMSDTIVIILIIFYLEFFKKVNKYLACISYNKLQGEKKK